MDGLEWIIINGNRFRIDSMGNYDVGQKYAGVPVLKFMGYDKIVVLLNGRPEEATIEGSTNNFCGGEIYHITAPSGTVADIEIVDNMDEVKASAERSYKFHDVTYNLWEARNGQAKHNEADYIAEYIKSAKKLKEFKITLLANNIRIE